MILSLMLIILISFITGGVAGFVLSHKRINCKNQHGDNIKQYLNNTASHAAHLTNVISGINHEVSPWVGGIQNIAIRLKSQFRKTCHNCDIADQFEKKIESIEYACKQTRDLLSLMSRNVKALNQYNNYKSNLKDTIISWVNITLMDRFIKDIIDENHFIVDKKSLDWETNHSPMLLAQVILNLVKNSIEHNPNMFDNIMINFRGDEKRKCFIYEDNGKGIPPKLIDELFVAGITTKENKAQHGFGLALCREYCLSMNATIKAVKSDKGACFIIKFEQDDDAETERFSSSKEYMVIRDHPCFRTFSPDIEGDKTYESDGMLPSMPEEGERT